ncbi:hypothetical protein JCM14036_02660 [Desulfotomaculum defluvii]
MAKREVDTRKREDKKVHYNFAIEQSDYDKLRMISFNARISIQRILSYALINALENDHFLDKVYAAHPPQGDQFILVREDS